MQRKRIGRSVALRGAGALAIMLALGVFYHVAYSQSDEQLPAHEETNIPGHNVIKYGYDPQSNFIRMPLPPGMEVYGSIRGAKMQEHVKALVAISLKDRDEGNLLWGRTAGTKNDVLAEDYVMSKFKEYGLQDIHKQTFKLAPQWFPTSWSLTATGSGQTLHFATARAYGVALPPGGVDLDPVWVGLGTEQDFVGRDVKGKMALIWSQPTPGVVNNSATWIGARQRAAAKGAAVALINVAIPGNYQIQAAPNPNSATGPTTFTMGTDDTSALRALMGKGPVKLHAEYTFEMRPNLTDSSVWGTLPGMTDENIIVFAHHDAVFTGALDNASGVSVMLGLAEYFSKIPKAQRRRTIYFLTTAGHHAGSAGTAWMHDNRDTFLAKTALAINCEHVSVAENSYMGPGPLRFSDNVSARRWWLYGSPKLASIILGDWRLFGVTIWDTMEPRGSGDMTHIATDAPTVHLIVSPVTYHTNMPEIVPNSGMEAVARAYAKIIDDINKVDRKDLLEVEPSSPSGTVMVQ